MKKQKLLKQPCKGTRDWYPEDIYQRNYIFDVWSKVARRYGYEEYDTPLIEDTNLYRVKSGDEIVNNQLYSFKDKGDRDISLRPEMTPSLARIVVKKKNDLTFPLRWFNIGRYYRYEKPQKGRNREFFQLNIDILGIDDISAEIEIIQYVIDVMKEFKAPENTYELKVNSRYLLDYLFTKILILDENIKPKLTRALDNYFKIDSQVFKEYLKEISLSDIQISKVLNFLNWDIDDLKKIETEFKDAKKLIQLFETINSLNIPSVKFSPSIVRGLAYYTDIVIELYDIGGRDNTRALFGGGRYNDLLEIFGEEKIPAFGLGWGDTTTLDYLKSYDLLPQYKNDIDIFVCLMDKEFLSQTLQLSSFFRSKNLNTLQQLETKKLSNQLKYANRRNIPWVVILGEEEIKKGVIQLKNMQSRESFLIKKEDIIEKISKD
jgi:histidyl-tRNA synthetase